MKERIALPIRTLLIGAIVCAVALSLFIAATPRSAQGQTGQAQVFRAPTDKAAIFFNKDIQAAWQADEAKQVNNQRIMEGGTYSVNVRIVKPDSPPMFHAKSVDLWIVEAGTATAVTGGELLGQKKNTSGGGASDDITGSSISGGIDTPITVGDIVFVPPTVPHTFKDMKGFRALLIRWDVK